MKLPGVDFKRLVTVVADFYDIDNLRIDLRGINHPVRIVGGGTLDAVVYDVVLDAERTGRLADLLTMFAACRYPDVREVADELLRGQGSPAMQPDPFLTDLVGQRLYVDRTLLRSHFKDLVSASKSRVLVVTGQRPCGKSFTYFFVTHIAARLGTFRPVLLDLADWNSEPCTPYGLMASIAKQLRLGAPTMDQYAPGAAQAVGLVDWLVGELNHPSPKCQYVFVIDGLDRVLVLEETGNLLALLAGAALREKIPGLRVVLLGYSRFDLSPLDSVLTEDVRPIDEPVICDLFLRLADLAEVDLDREGAELAAKHVFRLLPKDPRQRIGRMSEVIRTVEVRLFGREVL